VRAFPKAATGRRLFRIREYNRAFIDKTLECSLLGSANAVSKASFARKIPDKYAPDCPTPEYLNPTQDTT
jgi:hypothetical protein